MYLPGSVETSYYSPFVSGIVRLPRSRPGLGARLSVSQLERIKTAPEGTRWCGYIQKASMSRFR